MAGAIFVLSLAVLLLRFASEKDDPSDKKDDPSDTPGHGGHLDAKHAPDAIEQRSRCLIDP